MRAIIIVCCLSLCSWAQYVPVPFTHPSGGTTAPTIIQSNGCFVNSGNPVNCSFGSAVTAGNEIIAICGMAQNSTISSVTMTGETFTNVAAASNSGSAGHGRIGTYEVASAVGGQTQVTCNRTTGNADIHLIILEIHGQPASPDDATGNTNSTTLSVSTSGATTVATDLVVAGFMDDDNNQTFTAGGSGYTQCTNCQTNNTTGGDAMFVETKTTSSTGTQTAAPTGNAGDTVAQGILAIKGK